MKSLKGFLLSCLFVVSLLNVSFLSQKQWEKQWLDRLTLKLCVELKAMGKQKVTAKFYRQRVQWAWEAAALNPSWGTRTETTIRSICADYGESGMGITLFNFNNDGSVDLGEMHINSVHWMGPGKTEWVRFCEKYHFKPTMKNLMNTRINMMFAMHLNEIFCKNRLRRPRQWVYGYDDSPERKRLYEALVREADVPLKVIAENK